MALTIVALASGCGSSTSSTSSLRGTPAPSTLAAIARHALDRLNQALPLSTGRLPAPSTSQVVERAYLTALFDDAQRTWRTDFADAHLSYQPAHLVVFWNKIESACGKSEDSGPFYCPADRTVYLDLRFFTLLVHGVGVRGIAQAYIVGHEVAHHIQKLLGITHSVGLANRADPRGENARSVRIELEADCLAGVWGRSAYGRTRVTTAELQDAVKTADVIGDDYAAQVGGDTVDPSLWKHGSSQQRQSWLRTGFRSGRPNACNTFG